MDLPKYRDLPLFEGTDERHAWGVWGADDELGMLNLLTPEKVKHAASLVKKGRVFNLEPSRAIPHPASPRAVYTHHISVSRTGRSDEAEHYELHGGMGHLDGLRHIRYARQGYYGGRQEEDLDETGLLGFDKWAQHGIVGRGVLIDWAGWAARHNQPFNIHEFVTIKPDLIETIAKEQNVAFQPGDIMVLRTGWMDWWLAMTPEQRLANIEDIQKNPPTPYGRVMGGLDNTRETAEWLWDHQFVALWGDNQAVEAIPAPGSDFQHRRIIAMFGMGVGELFTLQELAQDCIEDGVYEFMVTAKPDNIPGLVGSPAHAYAIK